MPVRPNQKGNHKCGPEDPGLSRGKSLCVGHRKGVAHWWIREDVRRVRAALSLLVRRKIVQAKVLNEHDYYLLCERYRGNTLFSELDLIGQGKANASRKRGSKKR